jgi:hypothetical protein
VGAALPRDRILDEFTAITGLHRKHAAWLLRAVSWALSGAHTEVSSPALCSRVSFTVSRRSVSIRSPGAAESQRWRDHDAAMASGGHLALDAVAARHGIVANVKIDFRPEALRAASSSPLARAPSG